MSLLVDKKVLQSQYSRNNLNIHFKLVSLYVSNLNSLATTAALIATLSFGCIHEFDYPTKYLPTEWRFGYFYTLVSMLALIFSILSLSQTTICLIFGPTMFLFGESHSDSLSALNLMRHQQREGFFWSCSSVAMAYLQALFFVWGVAHLPVACIVTVTHLIGYYIIYTQGMKTMNELLPKQSSSGAGGSSGGGGGVGGGGENNSQLTLKNIVKNSILGLKKTDPDHPLVLATLSLQANNFSKVEDIKAHLLQIRRRGYLWTKNANKSYQSDYFVRVYVVLDKAEIIFYREKEDFIESNQPITDVPIRLKYFEFTNSKRIITQYTHPTHLLGAAGIRQLVTGTAEMRAADYLNAKFDLLTALTSLKFSLIPTSENELLTLVPLHFMAETETEYNEWVEAILEIQSLNRTMENILNHVEKSNNIRLHQDAQASLQYANIADRLPDGMEV